MSLKKGDKIYTDWTKGYVRWSFGFLVGVTLLYRAGQVHYREFNTWKFSWNVYKR